MKKKVLIIGGDSKIAKYLIKRLKKENFKIIATTRRKKNISNTKIFLDLYKIKKFVIPKKINVAVILAGVDGHKKCSKNYNYSFQVNSINIPDVAKKLISQKIFVCFVTSSSVFTYKNRLPKENSKYSPSPGYGKQKVIAEKKILNFVKKKKLQSYFSILRISKNVNSSTKIFSNWIKKINNRKKISAFRDLYFSPISFNDTTNMLFKIINRRYHGIYHLSGEKDISYASFADKLIKFNNLNIKLVNHCYSYEKKMKLIYKNKITGLDMKRTSKITKIKPVKVKKILNLLSLKIK